MQLRGRRHLISRRYPLSTSNLNLKPQTEVSHYQPQTLACLICSPCQPLWLTLMSDNFEFEGILHICDFDQNHHRWPGEKNFFSVFSKFSKNSELGSHSTKIISLIRVAGTCLWPKMNVSHKKLSSINVPKVCCHYLSAMLLTKVDFWVWNGSNSLLGKTRECSLRKNKRMFDPF